MSILGLGPHGRDAKFYLQTEIQWEACPDRLGLHPALPAAPLYLGGKNDGKPVEDGILLSNSSAVIFYGDISVRKGLVRVVVNPALHTVATVSSPVLLGPEPMAHPLFLIIRAHKTVDLNSFGKLLRIYIED